MENGYVSLYRKYRPKTFRDVAGHKNVKDILVSEIVNHSLPSSLLFVGQKGTGKTSMAKILAKVINCTNVNSETGEACDSCDSCKMANSNSHPDIFEIDAASNNGVDEIRNINASVFTLPILGSKKIFIIDEVHMLTSNAFNAFLKTLEEPPAHVTFILATTEFQKIPATILSRCQVFNFKKIGLNDVKDRMKEILNVEQFTSEEIVLNEIYYLSDGSLRDALNYLEQLMMISKPNLTIDKLTNLFSIATKGDKIKIFKNIFAGDSRSLISFFEGSMQKGLDVEILILQLVDIVKEIIEYRITNEDQILNYLDFKDIEIFKEIPIKKFYDLADVLVSVYEKTNKTNISYQYLIVTLLNQISNLSTTLISVVDKQEEIVEDKKDISVSQPTPEIKMTDFIEQKKAEPKIIVEAPEQIIEPQNEIIAESVSVEIEEPLQSPAVEFKTEIQKEETEMEIKNMSDEFSFHESRVSDMMLKLVSKVNYESLPEINFAHKKILNVLLKAQKVEREKWSDAFNDLFKNEKQLNELVIVFRGAKVVAACPDAIIIYIASPIYTKIANNLLQDSKFRDILFAQLNLPEINIFVVEKDTWGQIRDEYADLKNSGELPEYNSSLFNNFYQDVIRHNEVVTQEEDEILKRARDFFGDISIKVVD